MKRKGIPLIKETLTPKVKTLKGFYPPAFIQIIEGNFTGLGFLGLYRKIMGDSRDIGLGYGLKEVGGDSRDIGLVDVVKGTDGDSRDIGLGYGYKEVGGDSRDIGLVDVIKWTNSDSRDIGLVDVVKVTDGDSRDIGLGYGYKVSKNSYGIEVLSILNYVRESASGLKGAIYNRCKEAKTFLINFGVINRVIEEPDKDTFLLQLGLYNTIGDSAFPIANFRNFKGFPSQFKKYIHENYSKDKDKNVNESIS